MQCLDCGHELTVEEEDGTTYVKPCEKCMQMERKEGYEEGYAEGSNEG